MLSVDEKTQIQALDRTQPLLPIDFGVTEKRTHDYKRHGVANLYGFWSARKTAGATKLGGVLERITAEELDIKEPSPPRPQICRT